MEPENELEKHLNALKISGADSSSFPPPVPEGEEDTYIKLHYKLGADRNSMKIHQAKNTFTEI